MTYVVAALVALSALVGAHELGHWRGAAKGKANLAAFQAEAKAEAESHKAVVAQVETKVVVQWRDRVKVIREVLPEVVREIEVIRNSDCVLPPEFRLLHDHATGEQAPEAGSSADPAAETTCLAAVETVIENYKRARETSAQLEALQEWAMAASE